MVSRCRDKQAPGLPPHCKKKPVNAIFNQVRQAALSELSKFDWTDHSLKAMPDYCKAKLKLPVGHEAKEDVKPEDVLDFVPGEVWIELVEFGKKEDREALVKFVSVLLSKEIDSLPRSAFSLTQVRK